MVIKAIWPFWEKANLPTTTKKYAGEKLMKLIDTYEAFKKNRTKPQEGYRYKEDMFKSDLEDVFDIAHSSVLASKIPQEDKDFLISQREDRMSSSLAGVDQQTKKKKAEKRKRDLAVQARKTKSDTEVRQFMEVARLEAGSSSNETNTEDEDDTDETYMHQEPSTSKAQTPKRRRRNVIADSHLIASWDRDNLSVKQATSSFAAAAQSLGHDLDESLKFYTF